MPPAVPYGRTATLHGWAVLAETTDLGFRSAPSDASDDLTERAGVTVPDPIGENREQAYVPAEQPPPSQGARIPAAHAHPRRALHPVCASPQGPQEPRGLSPGLDRPRDLASVLPAPHRLTRGDDLRRVSRDGRRGGSDTLVVHLLTRDAGSSGTAGDPVRVGFVVSRAVGSSVLRHRVQRRLRHLCRDRLSQFSPGSELVVRALAPAGRATYQELGADLDRCLQRALDQRPGTVS